MLFSLFSCDEYTPAINGSSQGSQGGDGNGEDGDGAGTEDGGSGDTGGDVNDPGDDFTVSVKLGGKSYRPTTEILAYWSDGQSIHSAPLNKKGVAYIDGLNGDYRVTLSQIPEGYAYDPNAYVATNDNRDVVIELIELNKLSGSGTGLYDCYEFKKVGVYQATLNSAKDGIFFEFAPQVSGTYTIESWVDIYTDNVNPYVDVYTGSSAYKLYSKTTDAGGACGSYTRNFVHTVEIADQMISAGGSQTYTFAVKADSKTGDYPITVTFAVKRNGGFDLNLKEYSMAIPKADLSKFDFDAFRALAGTEMAYPEIAIEGDDGFYIFDEDNFKLWPIEEGGDGVYHVYDEEKYASTGGYGPVLFAFISAPCRNFLDRGLSTIEYAGNKNLTVGDYNYKHFIEGYTALSRRSSAFNDGSYYCSKFCPCHAGQDYDMVCPDTCPDCNGDCRTCPEELIGNEGYFGYCNSDGVAPVTEELKEFLQLFSESQRYFADGEGWIENNGTLNIDAYEDSQWLWACGYYVEG